MSIFDSISKYFGNSSAGSVQSVKPIPADAVAYFQTLMQEGEGSLENTWDNVKWAAIESYKNLENYPLDFRINVLKAAAKWHGHQTMIFSGRCRSLMSRMLQKKSLILKANDVRFIVEQMVREQLRVWNWPTTPLMKHMERCYQQNPKDPDLNWCIAVLLKKLKKEWLPSAEETKLIERLKQIGKSGTEKMASDGYLGELFSDWVKKHPNWKAWVDHISQGGKSTRPATKWLDKANGLNEKIGNDIVQNQCLTWLQMIQEQIAGVHKGEGYGDDFLKEQNTRLIRSLIWVSALVYSEPIRDQIEEMGLLSFKKIPGFGAASAKIGNSCITFFTLIPMEIGVPALTKYKSKIRYSSALKQVEKAIESIAKSQGLSPFEIEEQGASSFGLNQDWEILEAIGDYTAIIRLEDLSSANLFWKSDEKERKTVPADVKIDYKEDVSRLKKVVKELKSSLSALKWRLESTYLDNREWVYSYWTKHYLNHHFVSFYAKKLIWHFEDGNHTFSAFWYNENWVDADGKVVDGFLDQTKVRLWHPSKDTVENIRKWRDFIESNEYQQPFKQAHREIYILTDAEVVTETYSNRFAAHILRQHQFAALCKQRLWKYTLQGQWDSHNIPTRQIPAFGLYAEYWVDAPWEGEAGASGVFNYVHTDQVRFYNSQHEQLPLVQVPQVVFSEIMRDVDLFVGVTSIGNDPSWEDGRNQAMDTYWTNYSTAALTENAKMRKQLLEKIIGRMKIAKVAKFDDRYLHIAGKIRTYKIHLGSGNILMEPDNSYLCIVQDHRNNKLSKIYLPFEGDRMLSIILSKAILLADDDKITDSTIVSQIQRR